MQVTKMYTVFLLYKIKSFNNNKEQIRARTHRIMPNSIQDKTNTKAKKKTMRKRRR